MRPAMIRTIDAQGRFIIPSEIRKTMNLSDGDALEIHTEDNQIHLTKYCGTGIDSPEIKQYLEILYSVIRCSIAICSEDYIILSKGIGLLEGASVSADLSENLRRREQIIFDTPVYTGHSKAYPVDTLIPLPVGQLQPPMGLLLFRNGKKQVTDEGRLCAKMIAMLISKKFL